MLKHASHTDGVSFKNEIQFATRFDYMFPRHAREPDCLLLPEIATLQALVKLGEGMADPGVGTAPDPFDSGLPPVLTYLGQFIDHDITARTDRELFESRIAELDGTPRVSKPVDPDHVVSGLTNGRRPHLDLDSVYGDGPGLVPGVSTTAQSLYEADGKLKVVPLTGGIDLPRLDKRAIIADARNDENVMVSQLHASFLAFNNAIRDGLTTLGSEQACYSRARQLTRWAYHAIILNDYLPRICDPAVVLDVLVNGPRFYSPLVEGGPLFMPLEFSIAGFRFGHSMIRPRYQLNDATAADIQDLLLTSSKIEMGGQLPESHLIKWDNFLDPSVQSARKIDAKLSQGLFELPFGPNVLEHLAKRNLLRGYVLSLPTGQSVAHAMGIEPLSAADLVAGESTKVADAFREGCFEHRTPLWYYVLKEAEVQKAGQTLGAVGSRIIAETLIGLLKHDMNSVLNTSDAAVTVAEPAAVLDPVIEAASPASTSTPAAREGGLAEEGRSFKGKPPGSGGPAALAKVTIPHCGGSTDLTGLRDFLTIAGVR